MNKASRGAAWLDRHHPGWYNKIDPNRLDATSNYDCVIGQVFGDFRRFMNERYPLAGAYWEVAEEAPVPIFVLMFAPGMVLACRGILWGIRRGFFALGTEKKWEEDWRREILSRIDRDADSYSQMRKRTKLLAGSSDLAVSA